jgi:tRNA 2-selenouridine synthase
MSQQQYISIVEFVNEHTNALVLDVRSPAEYERAHLPTAKNIPLFTNHERAAIGTYYKQQGRQQAIKEALPIFGAKLLPIVTQVEDWLQQNNTEKIIIYCWRGGMRSAAVAWLLQLYGFKVMLINGGYKSYRQWCLQVLETPVKLKVLGGNTGTNKTGLLQYINEKEFAVIDIEQLANHKGSVYGNMGPQPTQENFENQMAWQLHKYQGRVVWVEDESKRLGTCVLPNNFWETLRTSSVYFLDVPFTERLQFILKQYAYLNNESLADLALKIKKRLGGLVYKQIVEFTQNQNREAAISLLLQYYDKQYSKGLLQRAQKPNQLFIINSFTTNVETNYKLLVTYFND